MANSLKFKVGDKVAFILTGAPLFYGQIVKAKKSKVNKTYTIEVSEDEVAKASYFFNGRLAYAEDNQLVLGEPVITPQPAVKEPTNEDELIAQQAAEGFKAIGRGLRSDNIWFQNRTGKIRRFSSVTFQSVNN